MGIRAAIAVFTVLMMESPGVRADDAYVPRSQETRVNFELDMSFESPGIVGGTSALPMTLESQIPVHRNIMLDFSLSAITGMFPTETLQAPVALAPNSAVPTHSGWQPFSAGAGIHGAGVVWRSGFGSALAVFGGVNAVLLSPFATNAMTGQLFNNGITDPLFVLRSEALVQGVTLYAGMEGIAQGFFGYHVEVRWTDPSTPSFRGGVSARLPKGFDIGLDFFAWLANAYGNFGVVPFLEFSPRRERSFLIRIGWMFGETASTSIPNNPQILGFSDAALAQIGYRF